MTETDGYRRVPSGGPVVRTDIVDVYVFRRAGDRIQFLQLLRASAPLDKTWHPVMGHVEKGERAWECALRELEEEIGLSSASPDLVGLWALEQTHPYYIANLDQIIISPRFAAEVPSTWEPKMNDEHSSRRWVDASDARDRFMWPGQAACCAEVVNYIVTDSFAKPHLKVAIPGR